MSTCVPLRLALGSLALLASCQTGHLSIPAVRGPTRALWVTRFDYRTREDVERAISDCAAAGANTILFQVRGNATAFYRSSFEPWAEELGGKDPGFDPLAVAVDAAHARGLALHAWVNVMPAWRGTTPPSDPRQVWNAHPEWSWYDQRGKRQELCEKFYVSLNPCLPEVRAYLVRVLRDIAGRYAIDGLHLDYIRFPNEPPATPKGSGSDWPRDSRTVALFGKATGKDPDQDRAAWSRWRTEQVTQLVREVRAMLSSTRSRCELSAAAGPVPGADGQTWNGYEKNLATNLASLPTRFKSGSYRAAGLTGGAGLLRLLHGALLEGDRSSCKCSHTNGLSPRSNSTTRRTSST